MEKEWELSEASFNFIGALIPLMRAPPLKSDHLPKAIPPNTITLENRISIYEFGRGI